jgi:1,4-dihydroxy-2-naphthoate octaprenyltransferase/chlorophyll synthase
MRASLTGGGLPASRLERWFYALKPASWPKLFVPALFGQILGARLGEGLDLPALGWGLAFTALGLGFIVLMNDWGDRDVDAIKRKMFPDGCSPKTIPDRILDARAVGTAGLLLGGATLLVAAGAESALRRPLAFEAGLGCMLIFVAYTLPPIRLNYRGGGELLEMLGVGAALPLYNAYLQGGAIGPRVWPWLAGFSMLSLASGVASGLRACCWGPESGSPGLS